VRREALARHAPFLISLVLGLGAWEIIGRNSSAAFMAPLSETLVRLWELVQSGELIDQTLSSAGLFASGLALAIVVGMPLGLLLARVRPLRDALDIYIMILYATPMVALIPFILSLMGFGPRSGHSGAMSSYPTPCPSP
jgi:ABC-type nitrate/sulfonate/bicarbonate transport system permease component